MSGEPGQGSSSVWHTARYCTRSRHVWSVAAESAKHAKVRGIPTNHAEHAEKQRDDIIQYKMKCKPGYFNCGCGTDENRSGRLPASIVASQVRYMRDSLWRVSAQFFLDSQGVRTVIPVSLVVYPSIWKI